MSAARRRARRRSEARRLRAEGLSVREIARRLKVGVATVHADLKAEKGAGPPPSPRGNLRAVKHGAHSQAVLADLQAEYEERGQERWPLLAEADVGRIVLWARLAARVDQLAGFERERGALRDEGGAIFDASERLSRWERQLEKTTDLNDVREADLAGPQAPAARGVWAPPSEACDPALTPLLTKLAGRPVLDVVTDGALAAEARSVLRHFAEAGAVPTGVVPGSWAREEPSVPEPDESAPVAPERRPQQDAPAVDPA